MGNLFTPLKVFILYGMPKDVWSVLKANAGRKLLAGKKTVK